MGTRCWSNAYKGGDVHNTMVIARLCWTWFVFNLKELGQLKEKDINSYGIMIIYFLEDLTSLVRWRGL
jgi:hypothetical protein